MTETEQAATAAAPAAKKREIEKVKMADGRDVEFAGKQRIQKEQLVKINGEWKAFDSLTPEELAQAHIGHTAIRIDFRNGTTRQYPLNPALALRFALHGASQKYGDQLAGEDAPDLDDWALSTDKLHEQLTTGEWAKARVGGGMGGTSVLLQALIRFTGRTAEEVREHIKDWTPQQKQALRNDPDIKPIVEEIEREKAAKAGHVDTSALKTSLKALVGGGGVVGEAA